METKLKKYKVTVKVMGEKEFHLIAADPEEAKRAAEKYFNSMSYVGVADCLHIEVQEPEEENGGEG